ncbi:MarR family transcriptional regulator [Gordonia sp. NB41Y]|uniref:MarR family winged helix-turn-helix transcriptional regulator n=1 Tax=Gordonia sp. NB41Y TaxID=875808 RepID=UPI0002BD6F8E|nr:MarR family transcriptional regulator [Gordonia sp. NB41Y]EMP11886.1 MarR family transcriptional regulator [Gordonia sp. NB41Y]WLP91956.1 MarR family transcriptional regulator [Gordonia sp. NB41Y]
MIAQVTETTDVVDHVLGEWARAYPDLDMSPVGILGRVQRIASVTSARLDRNLEVHGITRSEFDVLGALVRADRPLRASEVVFTTMLSGASVTKISDSLSRRGLLERHKSERDGRVVLLTSTDAGRALVDRELPRRLDDDRQVLDGLDDAERAALTTLLRKVSLSLGE